MVAIAKQGFKAPVTIRVGDREVIKVRQFVRIATNLSLTAGTYASDIPKFNPLRLFAEENGERYVEPAPEVADADVSVVKRDLTLVAGRRRPRLRCRTRTSPPILEEERRAARPAPGAARRADPGPADAVAAAAGARMLGDALSYAAIADNAVQRDRGAGRPGERHQPAARRGAARPSRWSRSATSRSRRAKPSKPSCAASAPRPTRCCRSSPRSARA